MGVAWATPPTRPANEVQSRRRGKLLNAGNALSRNTTRFAPECHKCRLVRPGFRVCGFPAVVAVFLGMALDYALLSRADLAREYPMRGQVGAENRGDEEIGAYAVAGDLRRGVA